MRTRTTIVLAALGAVVLALGIIYGRGPGEQTAYVAQGKPVFPGLANDLAGARQIEIVHKGKTLDLVRNTKDAAAPWGLADHGGYPVQASTVHELLAALTELRLDEPRTAERTEYARLGVEDPGGKGADSTLVRVLDDKGSTVAALIVGHAQSAAHGNADTLYVRLPGEAQSWLADGRISASTDPMDWLDRSVVNLDASKIATVTVTRGGTTLRFGRSGGTFTLTDPAQHPKLDAFKVEEVGRALADVMLMDVKPAPAPGTAVGSAVFTTKDGMSVTVDVNKAGADLWATFAATGKGSAALAAKTKGWAYELGSWKEQSLLPTLDDVKSAEAKPAAPATPAPATPAPTPAPAAPAPATK